MAIQVIENEERIGMESTIKKMKIVVVVVDVAKKKRMQDEQKETTRTNRKITEKKKGSGLVAMKARAILAATYHRHEARTIVVPILHAGNTVAEAEVNDTGDMIAAVQAMKRVETKEKKSVRKAVAVGNGVVGPLNLLVTVAMTHLPAATARLTTVALDISKTKLPLAAEKRKR